MKIFVKNKNETIIFDLNNLLVSQRFGKRGYHNQA
jgi:hypothetical protein